MSIFYTSNKSYYKNKNFYINSCRRQQIVNKLAKEVKIKKHINNKTNIFFLDDTKQFLGSYKIRGAISKISSLIKKGSKNICLASTGNFGLCISYLSDKNNIKCKVFVSKDTSKNKINKLKKFKAEIDFSGKSYDEAKERAKKYAKNNKVKFIDVCSNDIFYGNASLTLEAIKKIEFTDKNFLRKKILVVYPLGSGSLATPGIKILKYLNYNIDIATVEPKNFCKFYYKFTKKNKPNFKKSIAEGASVKKIPKINQDFLVKNVDIVSFVNDNEIKKSIKYLYNNFKIKSEGAGALAVAFFIKNKKLILKNYEIVLLPVCGSNIDQKTFIKIIQKSY
jgi:threonine dehydratase